MKQKSKQNRSNIKVSIYISALIIGFFAIGQAFGQVTIGSDTPPKTGALLDLNQNVINGDANSNKGLGLPRVALTSLTSLAPAATSPADNTTHIGLTVYNVATTSPLTAGIYTWNGTQWVKILGSGDTGNAWLTTGNAGTNPTANYVGTSDAVDLSIRTNASERMRITAAGTVGIGTTAPAANRALHVNANSNPLRFQGLPIPTEASTSLNSLVIDNNGDVYISQASSAGQILRVELEETTGVNTNPNPDYGGTNSNGDERAIRLVNPQPLTAQQANAPNGSPNHINTIRGASLVWGQQYTNSNNGAPPRTTDQVLLPPGVYKVTLRIVGSFSNSAQDNTLFIKAIVNNSEYSLSNNTMNSKEAATFLYEDFIIITGNAQTLDFTVDTKDGTANTFQIVPGASVGGGTSVRSLLLIERLR